MSQSRGSSSSRPNSAASAEEPKKTGIFRFLRRHFIVLARNYPARATLLVFFLLTGLVTVLLALPVSSSGKQTISFVDAFFTAVSSVCVTGLTVVDTSIAWSPFGLTVIAVAVFIGGLGVMTLAAMLAVTVSRHLGLTQRMLASDATRSGQIGGVSGLVRSIVLASVAIQLLVFIILSIYLLSTGFSFLDALSNGAFMAVSGFNNAGFVSLPGGIGNYVGSWGILLPITLSALVGAVGFPVLHELRHKFRTPRQWSLHTKLTLTVFVSLVLVSVLATAILEWNNPYTFGSLNTGDKILNSLLAGANTRSLGVSAIDMPNFRSATLFLNDVFMFIGGGSGSTAGGIKVTTLAVLALAVVAEARGNPDIEAFRRRISKSTLRLAVAVLFVATVLVVTAVFILLLMTQYSIGTVLFEAISAFGTVGLSLGITPALPAGAKVVLALLMFAGRLGPMTLAAALALRERSRLVRMPEARPIVG